MPDQFGFNSPDEQAQVYAQQYSRSLSEGAPGAKFATLQAAFQANDAECLAAKKDAKQDAAQAEVPDWIIKQLPPTDPRAIAYKQRVINGTD